MDEAKNRQTKNHDEENKSDWKKISDSKKQDEKLIELWIYIFNQPKVVGVTQTCVLEFPRIQ